MSPIIDVRTPESFTNGYPSGEPRLSSRIITIRVGYSFEPNVPIVNDSDEACDTEEDEEESDSLYLVPGAWPNFLLDDTTYQDENEEVRDEDTSDSDVNSETQNDREEPREEYDDCHEKSYIRLLLHDELEEDRSDDDENDCDYEYESTEEVDEEYDEINLETGFTDVFYVHEDDTDFKDTLIDAAALVFTRAKDKCFALHFEGIFDWTKKVSPHRKFVVDTCVAGLHSSSTVQNITNLVARGINADMATVLLAAYAKCIIEKLDPVRPWELANLCEYHEHTIEGEKCYKDKRGIKS
ncbi:hypothetical protein N0V95_009287 [Ascochyta clinopodiicola]|nr:hypothetical protein N0V95_009287 [Ascochyta clinopodiicola]